METSRNSAPLILLYFITMLLAMWGAYYLGAGKHPGPGMLMPILFLPTGMWLVGRSNSLKERVRDLPEPQASWVKDLLADAGFTNVTVSLQKSEYPRPFASGAYVSLSERVLREFSPSALAWSIKTDLKAASLFQRKVLPFCFLLALLSIYLLALTERPGMSAIPVVAGVLVIVAMFIFMGLAGYRLQISSDREFTVTEADGVAAKEALSIPYFAQLDRSPMNRWMFFKGELKGRAKALGMELERPNKSEV